MRSFASDNHAGVHPAVLEAIVAANADHAHAYGADEWSERADAVLKGIFGQRAEVFYVFLGTAANVLALRAMAKPHQSVICSECAHINTDECGAPENFTGSKLMPLPTDDGRIKPSQAAPLLGVRGFEHRSQPRVVSLTQTTEYGTLYTVDEIRAWAEFAHDNDLKLHMDGARLCNAAAALGVGLRELTVDAGVDVLSLGGTKNGMMYGEAVVFLDPALAEDFQYVRKQGMQLCSKMRFIAAQFEAMFGTGLWIENASRANDMAALLAEKLAELPQVVLARRVEANAVFVRMPAHAAAEVQKTYPFYVWNAEAGEYRLMTSYDTTAADIEAFVGALGQAITQGE